MPELPELQIIINQLKKELQYAYIDGVTLRDLALGEDISLVRGQKIIEIVRRGKTIYFQLSRDAFTINLAKHGVLMLSQETPKIANTRAIFQTTSGNLYLVDKTRTSGVQYIDKDETWLPTIGVDPLTKMFNFKMLLRNLKSSSENIQEFLMKEDVVSGIGRRYARSILHRSRLEPGVAANRIPKTKAKVLFWSIKNILREAIASRDPGFNPVDAEFDDEPVFPTR
ncbi:MAG: hypothetical protein HZC28_04220 [Spirochaetes bacterium]|nr:hypothetical protein [Spirochaetota bacterium]